MQIVIPMSGAGERFRRAGYTLPKPLIEVEGKPIIAHIIDLFPGETDFVFICNHDHLAHPDFRMGEILERYCPGGRIVAIPPRKLGPIGAVRVAREHVALDDEVFVNYCDFTCFWDWQDFRSFVAETKCAGAVPAYRGFHPHSIKSIYYAYMKADGLWMQDIQEKQPFTDKPVEEFASSGGYYFRTGRLCLDAFDAVVERDMQVNGEYYVSLAYKILVERALPVAIYELQHFMQWGTPEDVAEYKVWSRNFRQLVAASGARFAHEGAVVVPMAGLGQRFADAHYALPKPLLDMSGLPMVVQARRGLPETPSSSFVLRRDMPGYAGIAQELSALVPGTSIVTLDHVTEGQAITCEKALPGLDPELPLTIGACDNGLIYSADAFRALYETTEPNQKPDVIVWTARAHRPAVLNPKAYGWVEADADGRIRGVRIKEVPEAPDRDPMIVGTFTFRKAANFAEACRRLVARNGRVNGEFYIDSLIEDAVGMGLNCQIFDIECYLGWGTPAEYETFRYWQSCFHKWASHPYDIDADPMVPPERRAALTAGAAAVKPGRPSPRAATTPGLTR